MKLTKKNIGDLVWVRWQDHSSSSESRPRLGLLDDDPVILETFGLYRGDTKTESVLYATYDADGDRSSESVWIIRKDIKDVKLILKKIEVAKL